MTLQFLEASLVEYGGENDKFKSMRQVSPHIQAAHMHIIIIDKFMKITFEYAWTAGGTGATQPVKQPNNQAINKNMQPSMTNCKQATKQPTKKSSEQPTSQATKQPRNQANKQPRKQANKQPRNYATKHPSTQATKQLSN